MAQARIGKIGQKMPPVNVQMATREVDGEIRAQVNAKTALLLQLRYGLPAHLLLGPQLPSSRSVTVADERVKGAFDSRRSQWEDLRTSKKVSGA
jgi:hypothetical protein